MGLKNDVILQTVTKVAVFIILAFSIHLFIGGHHNPGGGFVGDWRLSQPLLYYYWLLTLNHYEPV